MARTWKALSGCKVLASDGEIGEVKDFFFDIHEWTVRYFIVRTGSWLRHRDVLIAPEAVKAPRFDSDDCALPVDLTQDQVRNSPEVDTAVPLLPSDEVRYRAYFAWPSYWPIGIYTPTGVGMGIGPLTTPPAEEPAVERAIEDQEESHLRRGDEVKGYSIHAQDGGIGEVRDYVFDEQGRRIRYLVIDTHKWLPGRQVVISPQWIRSVDWAEHAVTVDLRREEIERAPEYREDAGVTAAYEESLRRHYGRHDAA